MKTFFFVSNSSCSFERAFQKSCLLLVWMLLLLLQQLQFLLGQVVRLRMRMLQMHHHILLRTLVGVQRILLQQYLRLNPSEFLSDYFRFFNARYYHQQFMLPNLEIMKRLQSMLFDGCYSIKFIITKNDSVRLFNVILCFTIFVHSLCKGLFRS